MSGPARYIMIGGFLGAGKSTAVLALADHLKGRGLRVGLITNDQSVGLVDTALMRSRGHSVEEIAGGCFCCRFDSLVEAADRLGAAEAPDVLLAEPVGSCTDLVATVSYPLRRIYGERYRIAPLSVMVDPTRAARVLGLREGPSFSHKVVYVYRKQIEEADLIVINKRDVIDAALLGELRAALAEQFPHARVLAVSCRTGEGLEEWFGEITAEVGDGGTDDPGAGRATMPIDYRIYAEGEALLGWLNATLRIEAERPIDGEAVMMDLAERIHRDLAGEGGDADPEAAEIAHLKMTLMPDGGAQGSHAAMLNLVRNDFVPELSQSLPEKMRSGRLIVNLRAEADPERLLAAVRGAVAAVGQKTGGNGRVLLEMEHVEHFRPAEPRPTWRMEDPMTLTPYAPADEPTR